MSWIGIAVASVSAVTSVMASEQQASALKLQSKQAELNSQLENLAGRKQAMEIEKQLSRDLASQNALFAARGSLQGEGSALAAAEASKANASRDIDLARFNSSIASLNSQQRSANLKSDASATRKQGYFNAAITMANAYGSYKNAGTGAKPKAKPSLVSEQ